MITLMSVNNKNLTH